MINLEQIKKEKCQSPPLFKKICPCTILPSPLFTFSEYPLLKGGGGRGGGGSELCRCIFSFLWPVYRRRKSMRII